MLSVPGSVLREFVTELLVSLDVPRSDAALVADCLVAAELEGQSAHGLSRLPLLAQRLRDGLIRARPDMRVISESSATALLDAGNALGPLGGARAMELAAARARSAGIGACAVLHGNHLGALGWYVERAARGGLVALAFSNTPPAMAPPGGRQAYLGTNPIAAAFPNSTGPIVIDLATSQAARGRIIQAARAGKPIPQGWALDAGGHPTTDAELALQGSLAPAGGAKGFALALLVEVLSGVLSGSGIGPQVSGTFRSSDRASDAGHFFLAIDPDAFAPGFAERMERLASEIRAVEPVNPGTPVRLPGDRRRTERTRRTERGVELSDELMDELRALGFSPG
jgi:LDH2 family malate/lactate/ureidoglycolate dehydrogenase